MVNLLILFGTDRNRVARVSFPALEKEPLNADDPYLICGKLSSFRIRQKFAAAAAPANFFESRKILPRCFLRIKPSLFQKHPVGMFGTFQNGHTALSIAKQLGRPAIMGALKRSNRLEADQPLND